MYFLTKGYLRLTHKRPALSVNPNVKASQSQSTIEKIMFSSLAGVLIVLLFFLLIVMYHRRKKPNASHHEEFGEILLTKNVYVSHCSQDQDEILLLSQFVAALKKSGVNVIIDIFSQVEINNSGGFSRWIPDNIRKADKILILLTENYLSALQDVKELDATSECVRKIHSEMNYMRGYLEKGVRGCTKGVVVVAKGVQKCQLLPGGSLDGREWYKFPKKFNVAKDREMKSILDVLVG